MVYVDNPPEKPNTRNGEQMKRNYFILGIMFFAIFLISGFIPAQQNETPLISVNIDEIIKQVKESVAVDQETLIANLEKRIDQLEARIVELEAFASLPTSTPSPVAAVDTKTTATVETTEPTRTPNPSRYDCTANRLMPYFFGEFSPGAPFIFQVEITNTGTKTWGDEVYIRFVDGLKAEREELYQYALPQDTVAPGETITINIPMVAPTEKTEESGKYESLYALNNGDENFCEFLYAIYTPQTK